MNEMASSTTWASVSLLLLLVTTAVPFNSGRSPSRPGAPERVAIVS